MIKMTKQTVGNNACVYIVENAPPDFDLCLMRARLECEGRNHRFTGGIYQNMTVKDAVLKDGKRAVFEIYTYIKNAYEPNLANSIREALKYFIKADRLSYSLDELVMLKDVFMQEFSDYQQRYKMNVETEIEYLDMDSKNKIRDCILY